MSSETSPAQHAVNEEAVILSAIGILGFYAQTGGNFRILLILLKSLHKGDFWVRPASLLPTDGLKA